jgi:hypothetical protein
MDVQNQINVFLRCRQTDKRSEEIEEKTDKQ